MKKLFGLLILLVLISGCVDTTNLNDQYNLTSNETIETRIERRIETILVKVNLSDTPQNISLFYNYSNPFIGTGTDRIIFNNASNSFIIIDCYYLKNMVNLKNKNLSLMKYGNSIEIDIEKICREMESK